MVEKFVRSGNTGNQVFIFSVMVITGRIFFWNNGNGIYR